MAVVLAAADSLAWWARQLASTPQALTAELGLRPTAPSPALFLPYLGGERTPHNDATVRGCFAGLGHEADRAALTRAVLEGVAFAFKDGLDALAAAGSAVEAVTAVGGGARSTYWLHVLASVLECPIRVPAAGDVGAAFGAARLAMAAAGRSGDAALFASPPTAAVIDPEPALVAAYRERMAAFRALYPAVKAALG
jgi:xylulokinase